jgi:predicted kinase
MVGVPGSGKSTWIRNQIWALGLTVVSTDVLVEQEAWRQGKTYNDVFDEYMPTAVKLMADQVVQAREAGHDIIWDQTSTTVASRARKFRMLPDYQHIAVVFPTPKADELAARLASRPGKIIPDHVVSNMIDQFEQPTLEEGFDEIWTAG